jgi:ABC-type bacteriocin/lantibiotic exporter with double-glycine peptidase domain
MHRHAMVGQILQFIKLCLGISERQAIPCIRQHNEEDCGAACLATVCARHRAQLPLGWIRHLVGTSREGTTLLGLKRGAEKLGFHAQAAKADASLLDDLQALPLPIICHWQGCHWVVLHGIRGDRLLVADPAVGLRQLSRDDFLAGWANGVVLLLEPDPARFPVSQQHTERWHRGQGLAIVPRLLQPFRVCWCRPWA